LRGQFGERGVGVDVTPARQWELAGRPDILAVFFRLRLGFKIAVVQLRVLGFEPGYELPSLGSIHG